MLLKCSSDFGQYEGKQSHLAPLEAAVSESLYSGSFGKEEIKRKFHH